MPLTAPHPRPRAGRPSPHPSIGRPPSAMSALDLELLVTGPSSGCASTSTPDRWDPAATTSGRARREAAAAIWACVRCPVRAACLEREMRHPNLGPSRQQQIRAGLTGGELRAMRKRWLAGVSVLDLLWPVTTADQPDHQPDGAAPSGAEHGRTR